MDGAQSILAHHAATLLTALLYIVQVQLDLCLAEFIFSSLSLLEDE